MASNSTTIASRFEACRATLQARNQQHVLRWWDQLRTSDREQLLGDVESVPWDVLDPIIATHVLARPKVAGHLQLEPAPVYPAHPPLAQVELYHAAAETGRAILRQGKVAAFTVAGGQGTRLGYDGPKGAVVVTPIGGKTLFQLFAETVLAARKRYATPIPWYIMTSPANHEATVRYLADHDFFGLPRRDVILFSQGMLPAFDFAGRLILESRHRLALAPDGHGGSLKALARSGALDDMRSRGIEVISYFQIDNPLVKPFDPLFLGLHVDGGAEMSTKVTPKADDLERVGNVCVEGGKVVVIEYSDFPEHFARAKNPDGRRRFDAGNLAIHLLSADFVDRVVGQAFRLPFRRAEKAVPCVDDSGARAQPAKPNGIKLETFVFDVLPLAANPLVLEVDRAEEFSPVKNATGVDSLETSMSDLVRRACRWLEAAGVKIPRRPDGKPDTTVVISPSFALDAEDVMAQTHRLPAIERGASLLLE